MTNEETPAIEYLEPPKRAHGGESYGGTVTVFHLRLMSPQQIAEHGLGKYAAHIGGENDEK